MTTESTDAAVTTAPSTELLNTKDMRRILGSAFMGSAIEYYDFLLYVTASSLVFNKVFFPGLGPGFALFASFATFAVGYVVRPLGGLLFGHFGDRVGRKKMLVLSLVMMGIATLVIGLLPTTAQIGIAAPITLVLLRVVQGVAVGGEWGGAALMAIEHAPAKHRGFAASFANAGAPAGIILGTLIVSLFVAISGNGFLVWGWRVPFLLSAVLILLGLVIRLKVAETPAFQRLEEAGEKRRVPIVDVLRHNSKAVVLGIGASTAMFVVGVMINPWGVSAAVAAGVDKNGVLNVTAAANAVMLVQCLVSARLSDKIGRRRVLTAGAILGAILAYPMLMLMTNGTLWGFALAAFLGSGIVQGTLFGPIAAYMAEQFPTRNRYTGASLSYQIASLIGAGLTPMISAGLGILGGGALWPIAAFWIATMLVSIIAVRATPEGAIRSLA